MVKSERQLEGKMRALLRKAELIDGQDDGQYGKGKRGDELPEELQRRSNRLEWIRKAKAELVAEAGAAKAHQRDEQAEVAEQDAAEAEASEDGKAGKRASRRARVLLVNGRMTPRSWRLRRQRLQAWNPITAAETDPLAMPKRTPPTDAARNPRPSAPRNFTDPDSHILKGGDGWIQGYNCQAAVDGDHQVIVAIGVSNQPSDAVHLLPMLERVEANTGMLPAVC